MNRERFWLRVAEAMCAMLAVAFLLLTAWDRRWM